MLSVALATVMPISSVAGVLPNSLYRVILSSPTVNLEEANHLMLLLDTEGITDSLIHFDRRSSQQTMRKAMNLYMASHYLEKEANMTATLQAARRAETDARAECDTPYIEEALALQSVACMRMGQTDMALKSAQEELRLDSLRGDSANLSRAYNILAGLSLQSGRLDDAKHYIVKATEIERSLEDSSLLSVRYGMAAEIYTKAGEYDRALEFVRRAYELDREAGNNLKVARRLAQMADIYSAQHRDSEAETFYLRAIEQLRQENEQTSLVITLKQLGQLYARQGQKSKAIRVLKECETICRSTDNRYILQKACRLLADLTSDRSPREAMAYMREAMELNDTLHSERAERLANEIRQSQAAELQDPTPAPDSEGSTLRQYALLAVAALAGVLFGLWYGRRKKQRAQAALIQAIDNSEATNDNEGTTLDTPMLFRDKELEFLAKVSELYEHNLERRRLSIDELAAEMCMSRSQFSRHISAATGESPSTYFNRLRLEKAARLLKDTDRSVSNIAYDCGFDDAAYFSNMFKKFYRVTPMQYRVIPRKKKD